MSLSQAIGEASEGILQSPRGERATVPTLGPSVAQLRLNWLLKNLLMKIVIYFFKSSTEYFVSNAARARSMMMCGGLPCLTKWYKKKSWSSYGPSAPSESCAMAPEGSGGRSSGLMGVSRMEERVSVKAFGAPSPGPAHCSARDAAAHATMQRMRVLGTPALTSYIAMWSPE